MKEVNPYEEELEKAWAELHHLEKEVEKARRYCEEAQRLYLLWKERPGMRKTLQEQFPDVKSSSWLKS